MKILSVGRGGELFHADGQTDMVELILKKKYRPCTYNVTYRRVRAAIAAVEKT